MKLTIKENINTESVVLRHSVLIQACELIVGREGVLETEKELYLMLAFLNILSEEDLITLCNEDERELIDIMSEDLEPVFFDIIKNEKYKDMYTYVKRVFLERCKTIWDDQHSVIGTITTMLDALTLMDETDKKEVLHATAKLAEQAYDRRTEQMTEKMDEANNKLEQFVRNFQDQENSAK